MPCAVCYRHRCCEPGRAAAHVHSVPMRRKPACDIQAMEELLSPRLSCPPSKPSNRPPWTGPMPAGASPQPATGESCSASRPGQEALRAWQQTTEAVRLVWLAAVQISEGQDLMRHGKRRRKEQALTHGCQVQSLRGPAPGRASAPHTPAPSVVFPPAGNRPGAAPHVWADLGACMPRACHVHAV